MRNRFIILILLLILCTVLTPIGVSAVGSKSAEGYAAVDNAEETEEAPTIKDLKQEFKSVFSVIRICGISCAALCIAICGVRYFTGNEEQAAQAKQVALYALIALVVLLLIHPVGKLVKSLFYSADNIIISWQPPGA